MALIGHSLHFSYNDMMKMSIKDFLDFVDEAKLFVAK